MSSQDIDKAYISPIDKFLYKFDEDHEKSRSQLEEIAKHKRIGLLRDNPDLIAPDNEIWEKF